MNSKTFIWSVFLSLGLSLSPLVAKTQENTKFKMYECLAKSPEMKCIFYIWVDWNKVSNTRFSVKSKSDVSNASKLENFLQTKDWVWLYATNSEGKPYTYNPDWLKSVECAKMK